ncbi:hypothetical protein IC575_020726 [Cucumis melo]
MSQSLGLISVDGTNPWILDLGDIDHLTGFSEHFVSYTPYAGNEKIQIADGFLAPIAGKGQIDLNLGRTINTARHRRRLYILNDDTSGSSISTTSLPSSYFSTYEHDFMLWHFRLDHPNFTYMKYLFFHLFLKIDVSSLSCDVCIRTKQHRVSFPSQPYKPTQSFTLIHSDVWGPSKVTTSSGKRWFVTFIDDHTRLTWVYLITDKSEVFAIFQNFYHTIETQFHKKLLFFGVIAVENSKTITLVNF